METTKIFKKAVFWVMAVVCSMFLWHFSGVFIYDTSTGNFLLGLALVLCLVFFWGYQLIRLLAWVNSICSTNEKEKKDAKSEN